MPAVVSNATRIWEVNIHWDLYAQCGIWDQKGKGVDIWECVRARESSPVTCRFPLMLIALSATPDYSTHATQPPNNTYWRYVARR